MENNSISRRDDNLKNSGVRGSNHIGQNSDSASADSDSDQEFQPARKGSSAQSLDDFTEELEEEGLDLHLEDQVEEEEYVQEEVDPQVSNL